MATSSPPNARGAHSPRQSGTLTSGECVAIRTRARPPTPRRRIGRPHRVGPTLVRAELVDNPVQSARSASLRHVSDRAPGITRVPSGKGFRYLDPAGAPIPDADTLS